MLERLNTGLFHPLSRPSPNGTLGLSVALHQEHSNLYAWFEGFCCTVSQGQLPCDP